MQRWIIILHTDGKMDHCLGCVLMKLSLTFRPQLARPLFHPLPLLSSTLPSFISTDTERQFAPSSSSNSCSTFRKRLLPASSEAIVSVCPSKHISEIFAWPSKFYLVAYKRCREVKQKLLSLPLRLLLVRTKLTRGGERVQVVFFKLMLSGFSGEGEGEGGRGGCLRRGTLMPKESLMFALGGCTAEGLRNLGTLLIQCLGDCGRGKTSLPRVKILLSILILCFSMKESIYLSSCRKVLCIVIAQQNCLKPLVSILHPQKSLTNCLTTRSSSFSSLYLGFSQRGTPCHTFTRPSATTLSAYTSISKWPKQQCNCSKPYAASLRQYKC